MTAEDVELFLATEGTPLLAADAARRQAQREKLKLLKADNRTGFAGVRYKALEQHPYKAWHADAAGRIYHLGYWGCAEAAALAVARKRAQLEADAVAEPPMATSTGAGAASATELVSVPSRFTACAVIARAAGTPDEPPCQAVPDAPTPRKPAEAVARVGDAGADADGDSGGGRAGHGDSSGSGADGGSGSGGGSGGGGDEGGGDDGAKRKKRKMTPTHREAIRRCKARARQRKLGLEVTF